MMPTRAATLTIVFIIISIAGQRVAATDSPEMASGHPYISSVIVHSLCDGVHQMQELSLSALQAFAAVAEHKGFRRAAADLGMSPSAVSHAVGAMEERLGTRLLNRTTRSVAVTDAGSRLLERLRPALDELGAALREASDHTGAPHGTVRLNVSRLAAMTVLEPRLAVFMARFPEVQVEVIVEDAMTDIVARGFDAGIRLGEKVDRDMIAVPVGPALSMRAVAAPSFLATHPAPAHPSETDGLPLPALPLSQQPGAVPMDFRAGRDHPRGRTHRPPHLDRHGVADRGPPSTARACCTPSRPSSNATWRPGGSCRSWPSGARPSPVSRSSTPAADRCRRRSGC